MDYSVDKYEFQEVLWQDSQDVGEAPNGSGWRLVAWSPVSIEGYPASTLALFVRERVPALLEGKNPNVQDRTYTANEVKVIVKRLEAHRLSDKTRFERIIAFRKSATMSKVDVCRALQVLDAGNMTQEQFVARIRQFTEPAWDDNDRQIDRLLCLRLCVLLENLNIFEIDELRNWTRAGLKRHVKTKKFWAQIDEAMEASSVTFCDE